MKTQTPPTKQPETHCPWCNGEYGKPDNQTFHYNVCPNSLAEQLKRLDEAADE